MQHALKKSLTKKISFSVLKAAFLRGFFYAFSQGGKFFRTPYVRQKKFEPNMI